MDCEWFHIVDNQKVGPISRDMLLDKLKKSIDWRDEYVWRQGMTDWAKAGSLADLAVAPPPLPMPGAPKKAPGGSPPKQKRSAFVVVVWLIAAPILLFAAWVVVFAISEAASDTETFASRSGLSISECLDVAMRSGQRYDQSDALCRKRIPKNK